MKKLIIFIFSIICIVRTGYNQSIVYDLMMNNPDYHDTLNPIDSSFKRCDSTWTTNVEWDNCLATHIDAWTKYMNETYDTLISLLDTTGQRLLKKSQEYWAKSNQGEDQFSNYIIFDVGNSFFGREGDLERLDSDMAEIKARAMELKSCLFVVREMNKEREEEKQLHKSR